MKDRFIIPGRWHTVAPINYGYQECPPGHTFGPAIREYYLLHYIFSGNGYFVRDGVTYTLAAGDIFVIRPGEMTTYYASCSNPWKYCWLGFTTLEAFDFLSAPVIRQSQALHVFQNIRDCCDKDNRDGEIFALTFQLLCFLSQKSEPNNQFASDYALYAKTHLDNTYMQKVSIAQIANMLHIDRRYLSAVFRKTYGCSPQEYLSKLRLERAKAFLQAGYSVTSTATMTGFSDLCNFSRQFKAYYGYSPSSLRQRL